MGKVRFKIGEKVKIIGYSGCFHLLKIGSIGMITALGRGGYRIITGIDDNGYKLTYQTVNIKDLEEIE